MLWLQPGLPKSPANVVAAAGDYCKLLLLGFVSDANSSFGLPQTPLLQVGSDANSYLGVLQLLFLQVGSGAWAAANATAATWACCRCCSCKLGLMQLATRVGCKGCFQNLGLLQMAALPCCKCCCCTLDLVQAAVHCCKLGVEATWVCCTCYLCCFGSSANGNCGLLQMLSPQLGPLHTLSMELGTAAISAATCRFCCALTLLQRFADCYVAGVAVCEVYPNLLLLHGIAISVSR